jgi:signal transduction histidine kinase
MRENILFLCSFFILSCYSQKYKEFEEVILDKEDEIGRILKKAQSASLDSSYYFTRKAKTIYEKNKDSSLYPFFYYRFGQILYNLNKKDSAVYYFNKATALYSENVKSDLLSYNYSYLGVVAFENENYDKAAEYYLKTIKTANNERVKAKTKSSLALLYIETSKYDLAKVFLNEVFDFYEKNTEQGLDHPDLIYNYSNLAKIETQLDKRIAAVNKMIAIIDKTEYSNNSSKAFVKTQALSLKGDIYLYADPKRYNEAIDNFKECIKLAKLYNLKETLNRNYILLGMTYNFKKDYTSSIAYLDSMSSYRENWMYSRINDLRYKGYFNIKKYDSAFIYANTIIQNKDSIIDNLETNGYIEYGKKYQTEKKIQENELLKKEVIIKDLQALRDSRIQFFLVVIIVLSIFLIRVIYFRNKKNKENAMLLEKKNSTINCQNKKLTQANQTRQRIFSIISHDLINPFNTVLGFSKILKEDYNNLTEQEKIEYIGIINNSSETNYNLTKSLLDWARLQENKIVVTKSKIGLKEVILNSIESLKIIALNKNVDLKIDIDEQLIIDTDENLLKTIIHNLVSNAIKFTPSNGSVHITSSKENKNCDITIRDTGIGISSEQLQRIRERNHISTKGTNNETGSGFGLLLCDELVELLEGTLTVVDSKKDKGTTVLVSLPNSVY